MAVILDGKSVALGLREDLIKRVHKLADKNEEPTIQIIRVGDRPDNLSYEKSILKNCEIIGIKGVVKSLPNDIKQCDLEKVIRQSNEDRNIHGILLFRPLPEHLDLEVIRRLINPIKDIDCMSPANIGRVLEPDWNGIAPCTPKAVMALMKHYNIPLEGKNVAMVGASLVVGRPLSMLLVDKFATVSVCHIYTKDVPTYTKKADIVITACGVPKLFGEKYFNENSIVIDVGINFDKNGKLCGDVDYDKVVEEVKAITPTAGGIGIITTTILLSHVVDACEAMANSKTTCLC
jgi:methylenetetrahydrofolate dehydrogenase (NADP+)/methenyltetrahydrofolate cyclohydrolase